MPKTTVPYWNPLRTENKTAWKPVKGLEGMAEEPTLSMKET